MAENEQQLIARLLAPLSAGLEGAHGLTDDAAQLTPPAGCSFVTTLDTLIDGVHFLLGDTPQSAADAAHKALAVNVSDLAAKGAEPFAYMMSLSLPAGHEVWLDHFVAGLHAAQSQWGLHLAGGDTVKTSGAFAISITAIGLVPTGGMIRRATANPGDLLMVSGTIGGAAAGLRLLTGNVTANAWQPLIGDAGMAQLLERTRTPSPRVELLCALRGYANAALDISDGLALDAARLASASGLAAEIDGSKVPLLRPAAKLIESREISFADLVTGGDDYEILSAVPPHQEGNYKAHALAGGVAVTTIGRMISGSGIKLSDLSGEPLQLHRLGFDHLTR
ncbi:MAG: thiamine-phosphate kinase [Alphaproteobacteria bacterium]|nr:thiamine-phosphate kinase [Alphaproteobacteria bacterium]